MAVTKPTLYLINGPDFKASKWEKEAPEHINLKLFKASRILFGLEVIRRTFFLKSRETVVIQRYLNDYPSLLKSLLLTFCDSIYIFYLKVRNIKLYWICHNIDRESTNHYKLLTKIRRWLMLRNSCKIFVLDPFFVKYAKLYFHTFKGEISSINFGKYEKSLVIHSSKNDVTIRNTNGPNSFNRINWHSLVEELKVFTASEGLVGFCAGSILEKKIYLSCIPRLLKASEAEGDRLKLIVVSNLQPDDNKELHQFLVSSDQVLFINQTMQMHLIEIGNYIDFYWTGYDDISMPYSVYGAVSSKTPTLSVNSGILPLILRQYNIGETLIKDYSNLSECLLAIKKNDYSYDEFLKTHTWDSLGKALSSQ